MAVEYTNYEKGWVDPETIAEDIEDSGGLLKITVVADQTAFDAATPGPNELVVLYAET